MRSRWSLALGLLSLVGSAFLVRGAAALPAGSTPPPPVKVASWGDNAVAWRGQNGMQVTVDCPRGGRVASVWGTFVYTDDSSICSAAVHAGAISTAAGGRVVIEIRAGEPSYGASTQNGVASGGWGAWTGSFVILAAMQGAPPAGPPSIQWTDSPAGLNVGTAPATFVCPPKGTASSVWGTGLYTDDSSICTAAAHTGAITLAAGGAVTIARRPGAASYFGSVRNGVTSDKWGAWTGSFVVLVASGTASTPTPAPTPAPTASP